MPNLPPSLTPDEHALLEAIYAYSHPTTNQLWRLVAPSRPKRYVERRLEHLRDLGQIEVDLLHPEEGARSQRYYHLLLSGARAIGKTHLGSQHYRMEKRGAAAARSARIELDLLARETGWTLFDKEGEMRQALIAYLAYLSKAQHGDSSPQHTFANLLPARLSPDLMLVTSAEVIPVIIAHPHAGRAFWRERLKKYAPIITRVRAIEIALTHEQQEEARIVIAASRWPRRYLVLQPRDLPSLVYHVQKSSSTSS